MQPAPPASFISDQASPMASSQPQENNIDYKKKINDYIDLSKDYLDELEELVDQFKKTYPVSTFFGHNWQYSNSEPTPAHHLVKGLSVLSKYTKDKNNQASRILEGSDDKRFPGYYNALKEYSVKEINKFIKQSPDALLKKFKDNKIRKDLLEKMIIVSNNWKGDVPLDKSGGSISRRRKTRYYKKRSNKKTKRSRRTRRR